MIDDIFDFKPEVLGGKRRSIRDMIGRVAARTSTFGDNPKGYADAYLQAIEDEMIRRIKEEPTT